MEPPLAVPPASCCPAWRGNVTDALELESHPTPRRQPPERTLPHPRTKAQAAWSARIHTNAGSSQTAPLSSCESTRSSLDTIGNWETLDLCLLDEKEEEVSCLPACSLSLSLSLSHRGYCHRSQELPLSAPMPKRTGGVSAKGSF